MPRISDLKLSHRLFLTAYRWRTLDPVPRAVLSKPLARSRVALVTSAGLVRPGDEPFEEEFKGGDFSHRILPADTEVASLREYHKSDAFDHRGIEVDRNVGFPLDRLRELAAEGTVGEIAPRHISLMGSITAPGRLQRDTAPAVAEILRRDEVDVALLVPV